MARSFNWVVVTEGRNDIAGFASWDNAFDHAKKCEDRGEFCHIYALEDPFYSTEDE